jgi:hypothetical protein
VKETGATVGRSGSEGETCTIVGGRGNEGDVLQQEEPVEKETQVLQETLRTYPSFAVIST